MKINIAGVLIDNISYDQTLYKIDEFVQSKLPHHIVTSYSEFIVGAQTNEKFRAVLNRAALNVPDGIGILWAANYLSGEKGLLIWLWSLAQIILSPKSTRAVIKEQVTGSHLIWDIVRLAQEKKYTLALVGGLGSVAQQSATILQHKFPGLNISFAMSDNKFDSNLVEQIQTSNSDILLVAFQPPKQEIWISENLANLNVKVAIGLGGTFDYIAGKRPQAPKFMHYMGLEWLWRLITQPWRIKRIWRAIVEFSWLIYKKG